MSRLSVLHLPLLPCFSRYASASSASSTTASIATKKPPYTQGASINVFHFVYTILCLSRETAVSRRTRMRNRFMAHSSFLVSTGNGRHILPQTSTICCSGDSSEVRTRSFAALRMTYPLQAVTPSLLSGQALSTAKGLARRTHEILRGAQDEGSRHAQVCTCGNSANLSHYGSKRTLPLAFRSCRYWWAAGAWAKGKARSIWGAILPSAYQASICSAAPRSR